MLNVWKNNGFFCNIFRCNLASVVLQLLAMGIPNILEFDFMDKPKPDHLESAVETLTLLGNSWCCIVESENFSKDLQK